MSTTESIMTFARAHVEHDFTLDSVVSLDELVQRLHQWCTLQPLFGLRGDRTFVLVHPLVEDFFRCVLHDSELEPLVSLVDVPGTPKKKVDDIDTMRLFHLGETVRVAILSVPPLCLVEGVV
jgi:hypothetical protein